MAIEIERELMQVLWLVDSLTLILDCEVLGNSLKELLRSETIEILNHAVVVEHCEL